jgi:glutamate/tyrosine decarboxylase-like PLP-dependent enzyme
MTMDPRYAVLDDAARIALEYIDTLPDRHVGATASVDELRARLRHELTEAGVDPAEVIAELAHGIDPGLAASAGPRYFGFVIGGGLPVAVAADWLTSAWDQNAGGYATSPGASVVEEVAAGWVRDILGLPEQAGVGFVTGCQMAHFTCLAAARHAVLRRVGWDVEGQGLNGAPEILVIAAESAHITALVACRLLGLGADRVRIVPVDDQGRMRVEPLRDELARHAGPAIVCAQAGEVNTGAFDPFGEIIDVCREHGAWCHVDGAFGLWAAASPSRRLLLDGYEHADSWATDAHKWLNVPYDCGIAIVADAEAQRIAMTSTAPYVPNHDPSEPWALDRTPEYSRRGRGVSVYAALRHLGRRGVAQIVDTCCDNATLMAERLAAVDGIEVINDVVLNQVLVRIGGSDAATNSTIERVQEDGTCFVTGSTFRGRAAMRVSIAGWQTTPEDIDLAADAIVRAAAPVTQRS